MRLIFYHPYTVLFLSLILAAIPENLIIILNGGLHRNSYFHCYHHSNSNVSSNANQDWSLWLSVCMIATLHYQEVLPAPSFIFANDKSKLILILLIYIFLENDAQQGWDMFTRSTWAHLYIACLCSVSEGTAQAGSSCVLEDVSRARMEVHRTGICLNRKAGLLHCICFEGSTNQVLI